MFSTHVFAQDFYEQEELFLQDRTLQILPTNIGIDSEYEDLYEISPINVFSQDSNNIIDIEDSFFDLSYDPNAISMLPFDLERLEQDRLLSFIEFYATEGRSRFTNWLARSGRYRDIILAEIARQEAPPSLLWIAAIESSFDNYAVSHVGATGMWQFMSRTARGRGMRIDSWIDERRDPEIATRYAIEYLQYQYDRFGSWSLAFVAYNAGSGHLRGEIRRHNVNDFWAFDDYDATYENARRYATRTFALAIIAMNPELFGVDGVVLDDPFVFETVELAGGTRLSRIARDAEIDIEIVREYNPALLRDRIPRDIDFYTIRLPADSLNTFVENHDDYSPDDEEFEYTEVFFGETMSDVADRVGLSVRVLRRANDFSSQDHLSYGTILQIPSSERNINVEEMDQEILVVPEQRFFFPNKVRIFYDINAQDTIREIADHFEVDLYELCDWNDLDPNATLWSRMTLQIWVEPAFDLGTSHVRTEEEVLALAVGSPEWEAHRSELQQQERSRRRTYRVRSGDSVRRIARRFDVSEANLIRWNRLNDDAMIRVGQELVISR